MYLWFLCNVVILLVRYDIVWHCWILWNDAWSRSILVKDVWLTHHTWDLAFSPFHSLECSWKLHCLWGKQRHMNPIQSMNPILRQVWQNYLGSLFLECIYYFQSPSYTLTLEEDERVDCEWFIINPGHLFDHPIFFRNNTATVLWGLGSSWKSRPLAQTLRLTLSALNWFSWNHCTAARGRVGAAWNCELGDLRWFIDPSRFGPPSSRAGAGHWCCLLFDKMSA